jgi:HK97 family phage portal protein
MTARMTITRWVDKTRTALKSWTLSDLARRFAAAQDEWNGASEDGVDVSQPYAQSVWVHACVSLIADNLARVPFVLARADDPDKNPVKVGELAALVEKPNRYQNCSEFISSTMTSLLLDGHVFWERYGMIGNRPREVFARELRKFDPDIQRDEFGDDRAFRWIRKQTGDRLIPGDELHEWKLYNPYTDVYGMAPLSPAALALYSDVATGVYQKAFFKNGARPGIVFSTEDERVTQEQCNTARDYYNTRFRGAKNQHQAFFVNGGFKPTEVGYTFSDLGIPDLKRLSKSEIMAIFKVPETLLGAQQKSAGVSIGGNDRKSDEENFILNTVMSWAEAFSWHFDHTIAAPFGNFIGYFDFRQVPCLQDRLLERAKEGREWTKCGATFNDVNKLFNLGFKDQPTGDDWWVPSNMLPARLLMDGPIAAEQPKDERDPIDQRDAKKTLRVVG